MRQNKGERRERRRGEGRVKSGRAGAKSRTAELCQYGGDGEWRTAVILRSLLSQPPTPPRRGGMGWEQTRGGERLARSQKKYTRYISEFMRNIIGIGDQDCCKFRPELYGRYLTS